MKNPAIYIDDTGTTQKSKSKYDPGNWKSFVAVILTPNEQTEITKQISEFKKIISKYVKINEFHFTEIFSGKGDFKNVDLNLRIEIFNVFSEIYRMYNCPIIIQSITDDDVIRNKMTFIRNQNKDGFNFSKNEHLTLWLLLIRIANNRIIENYDLPFDIFVDAGKQKPNTNQTIEAISKIATNSQINYINSNSDVLMQFIDFIAFVLNRSRWILMNDKKSESDIKILRILEYSNFNAINMEKKYLDIQNVSTIEEYNKILRKRYDINGNLTDGEVERIKNNKKSG